MFPAFSDQKHGDMFSLDNNFGSKIQTQNPFSQGVVRRASATPTAYRSRVPNSTRSAFARALTDQSSNDMRNAFDKAQQEYRQKAETGRSRDVQSQREFAISNYGLDREKEVTTQQQDVNRVQKTADLDAYMARARADHRVNRLQNLVNLVFQGGLLAAPTAGNLFMGMKNAAGSMQGVTGPMATDALSGYAPAMQMQNMPYGGLPLSDFGNSPLSRLR